MLKSKRPCNKQLYKLTHIVHYHVLTIFWPWASKTRGAYEKLRNAIAGRHRFNAGMGERLFLLTLGDSKSAPHTVMGRNCPPAIPPHQHQSCLLWPSCNIIMCMALFGSWLLFQCSLVLTYEKASNSIWGGQKVFILLGFTGLTLNVLLRSLSLFSLPVNNSHHRHLVWVAWAPTHELFLTVLCPLS